MAARLRRAAFVLADDLAGTTGYSRRSTAPSAPLFFLLALLLLLAPPASRTAVVKLRRTRTRIGTFPPKYQERLRLLAAMAANCVPAFALLRHTVPGKCGVSVLELCAADSAVAFIFLAACAATAQRSQRSQALATMGAAGQCGDVRAVSTTRGTLESTVHVPTDPTEGYTGTDGAATRLRPGRERSSASV